MWDIRRFARIPEFPARPVVVNFQFRDARPGEESRAVLAQPRAS